MAGTFACLFSEISKRLSENGQVDNLSSKFRLLNTDEERISFILGTDVICQALDLWPFFTVNNTMKSSALSEKRRLEGNLLFKKKIFPAALEKYTESIFNAECDSENSEFLAMALANRSAVLYQISDYDEALKDAEGALGCGYPEKLKYKLLERIGKCYQNLGKPQTAINFFKNAFKALSKADLPVDKKNKLAFEYCKLEKICIDKNETAGRKPSSENDSTPEDEKADSNAVYPCATSAFSVVYDANLGRHAIATRDIPAGELILFERPYASVLFHGNRLTHCYHCFKRCKTLIGCPKCNFVGFCDSNCKDLALAGYHSIECKFLKVLYDADVGLGHLALKMVIKAGFNYLVQFSKQNQARKDGINDSGVYDSLSYQSVFSLIGHSDKRHLSDLFRRTVLAVFLLRFVEWDEFFKSDDETVSLIEKKVCVGSHILKQLQMLPCNAHEVSELLIKKPEIANSELKEIGSAIYATLSLLNHSCDPSVVRHSYKNCCALRAIKNIHKGELIIDNYGALYAVTKFHERQSLVSSQYFFNCHCNACIHNWPLYHKLPTRCPEFRCCACSHVMEYSTQLNSRKIHCNVCQMDMKVSIAEFESSRVKFTNAMEAVLNGGNPKGYLPILLKHLQLMCDLIKLPWQEFNNCQETVKQCFSMLGNHYFQ